MNINPIPNEYRNLHPKLEFLYGELERVWNQFSIPSYHREVYYKYLSLIQTSKILGFLANEIDQIEQGTSPIQVLTQNIEKREQFVGKIKNMNEKYINSKAGHCDILDLECANYIIRLRDLTVKVFYNIFDWKDYFDGLYCEFYWNQICYIDKIKHDLDFLKNIGKFKFFMRDPLFLNTDFSLTSKKTKSIMKISPKKQLKIKKIQKYLNYGSLDLPSIKLSIAQPITPDYDHIFLKKIPTKQEIIQLEKDKAIIASEIQTNLIDKIIAESSKTAYDEESLNTFQKAVSTLIFEDYINETALKESEKLLKKLLLDYSTKICNNILEEFIFVYMNEIIDVTDIIVTELACDICDTLNFVGIIKVSTSEIREEIEGIVGPVLDALIESLLSGPWFESIIKGF
jgi:hypothetical protein